MTTSGCPLPRNEPSACTVPGIGMAAASVSSKPSALSLCESTTSTVPLAAKIDTALDASGIPSDSR
jgi:hypothetical protein